MHFHSQLLPNFENFRINHIVVNNPSLSGVGVGGDTKPENHGT